MANIVKRVAIYVFEGMSLFHLSVPQAIFSDAIGQENPYFSVQVCSERFGKLMLSGGLNIWVENGIDVLAQADILIFPSWLPEQTPSKELIDIVRNAHKQGKWIVGLCLGSYLLAYSGLLNGKRATSHWRNSADFLTRFPKVDFDTNPLFLVENNLVTSAGSAAAIDCCLHIFKRFYGVKAANQVARVMVSSPSRTGGQNQYIAHPVANRASDERLAKLIDFVLGDLAQSISVEEAASYCSMSIRSFTRHFKAIYGSSFTQWSILAKLNASLELLESSDKSILLISEQTGFSSEQVFRKHFKKRFDTTPQAWRKVFRNQ